VAFRIAGHIEALNGVPLGIDFYVLLRYAQEWLDTGQFYPAAQTAGPFSIGPVQSLYPPTFLYLIGPFIWLPAVLWWAIPGVAIARVLWWHRPAQWTWPIIALLLVLPRTQEIVAYGNPTMWVAAAVAAGTIWAWPAVLVAIKFTLAPFALVGLRRRSGWVALAVLVAASIPLWDTWLDYVVVLSNVRGASALYSWIDVPAVSVGLVAWIGSRRSRPRIGIAWRRLRGDARVGVGAARVGAAQPAASSGTAASPTPAS
jgi:hypothetical protein